MKRPKGYSIFLKLLKSGELLDHITDDLINANSLFLKTLPPSKKIAKEIEKLNKDLASGKLNGTEQASQLIKEWLLHLKAMGYLLNHMVISASAGKIKKYNSKSMLNFILREPVFKLCGIAWGMSCLVALIKLGFIDMCFRDNYMLYKVSPAGKKFALEEASLAVEEGKEGDFSTNAKEILEEQKKKKNV